MTTTDLPVWRTKKYADLTLAGVSGDGVFSGYASLFGEVDLGKDAIAPGAPPDDSRIMNCSSSASITSMSTPIAAIPRSISGSPPRSATCAASRRRSAGKRIRKRSTPQRLF